MARVACGAGSQATGKRMSQMLSYALLVLPLIVVVGLAIAILRPRSPRKTGLGDG